jgi:hypothetical protein
VTSGQSKGQVSNNSSAILVAAASMILGEEIPWRSATRLFFWKGRHD